MFKRLLKMTQWKFLSVKSFGNWRTFCHFYRCSFYRQGMYSLKSNTPPYDHLCSFIFKYFTNFLKDTTTTLPSLSVYLTGIARITQNREKCLIFIVFPQAWTKIRVNEKKKEKNSDNNNMRMNKSKANTLNIYAYVYVHTPIDMQIYINTDTPIHMNTLCVIQVR